MALKKLIIEGIINSSLTQADLENLTVELYDQSQKLTGAIAVVMTNKKGAFKFELNTHKLKRQFQEAIPEVFLEINKERHPLLSTMDETVLQLDKDIIGVKIALPKEVAAMLVPEKRELPKLNIRELLKKSGVQNSSLSGVEAKFKQAGLNKLESILSKPESLTTGRTGLDKKTLARFKGLTRFAVASGSESLGTKLVDGDFLAFNDLAAISKDGLLSRIGKLNKNEREALEVLLSKAQAVRSHVLNQMAYQTRRKNRDGNWQDEETKDKGDGESKTCGCPSCINVFSPDSYMVSLLDMIYYHWDLTTHELEQVVLQQIDDFDCSKGQECVRQIELAVEVLEQHGKVKLPIEDTTYNKEIVKVWTRLLFGDASVENLKQFEKLGKSGSQRQKDLIALMRKPNEGLKSIRKALAELKRMPPIASLKEKSLSMK